jgi:carboxyl-terminal processing protease
MNKSSRFLILALLLCVSPQPWGKVQDVDISELVPGRKQQQSTLIITRVIDRYHYKKTPLDDAMSTKIMDRYLEMLDPNKSFFQQKDIDRFSVYKSSLDDALRKAKLEPAFEIFRVYRKRVEDRVVYALRLVDSDFDFTVREDYLFNREDVPWAANRSEVDEIWRKRVKNDFLSLRMSGKQDKDIRETLHKRYEGLSRRVRQLDSDDVFQTFINAYTLSLEPHTSYMSPSVSENFDISMRLSLEGIGAVLRTRNEYTQVQKTVNGGPAKLSGQLRSGDRIVGIAQGEKGPMLDVVGWRLQDVVELIRGPKGTLVRLQILPKGAGADGPRKVVALVRNKIKLEDQAAKQFVIEGLDGMESTRIGVIEIPGFYRDFRAQMRGDKDFRSTTRDVRKLLNELLDSGVDGIIVDLRQNGGGSLSEATELTGLFIQSGPVVQVKNAFGEIEIEEDSDPDLAYAGPLAVLVDRNSASASEIFAGAIQDYRRGIIIGEPTFGKGTVQTLVDLDRFVRSDDVHLGRLRLTMAQFFRVNGGSTQFRGVEPDIVFPTALGAADHGERSLDNALPWASVSAVPVSFQGVSAVQGVSTVAQLWDPHKHRIANDPGFQLLMAEEETLEKIKEKDRVTLLESERKKEWEERENRLREQKNRFRISQGLTPLPDKDAAADADDEDDEDDEDENSLTSRIELNEAARILADYIRSSRPRAAMVH